MLSKRLSLIDGLTKDLEWEESLLDDWGEGE